MLPIDHLVYAVPDVDAAAADIAQRFGVTPTPGGAHAGFGTRNVLLALGPDVYLEIVGPDLAQPQPEGGRLFTVDTLTAPRLVTWAVRSAELSADIARARSHGYDPGTIIDMGRTRPDGTRLDWRLAVTPPVLNGGLPPGDGIVPFIIDWRDCPHPAPTIASGCRLHALRAEHPQPAHVHHMLEALGADLTVRLGPFPRLVAAIDTPNGRMVLGG
jgi:hypothetical protein